MSFAVGIGVITYNRRDLAAQTLDRVRRHTISPDVAVAVADDGSTDGTLDMLRRIYVPVVTGANRGIAWNKNRALFLLAQILRCETVILLEDDTFPIADGWEHEWIAAARRWGHINYAGPWLREHFVSGAGTAADPIITRALTAQCSAFSATCLTYGGYFHSRFRGYGHEHVEHTRRLVRLGFGGHEEIVNGEERVWYKMISGHIDTAPSHSYINEPDLTANQAVANQVMGREEYCAPWQTDQELRQFRQEMDAAMRDGEAAFRLTPASPPIRRDELGVFGRLLNRA